MGGCCSCLSSEEPLRQEPSPSTPLLHGTGSELNSKSARRQQREKQQSSTSAEQLVPVICSKIALPSLDKTFQDHSKLYNDLLGKFNKLNETVVTLKQITSTQGETTHTDLESCLKNLASGCGGAELKVKRSKYSIQIEYDPKEVSEKSTMPVDDVLEALKLYNQSNHLCKEILEKSSTVKRSVELVTDDEKRLNLDVMKSNLDSTEAPEAMKICIANVNKLKQIPGAIEIIQRHTEKTFNVIKEASKIFFYS